LEKNITQSAQSSQRKGLPAYAFFDSGRNLCALFELCAGSLLLILRANKFPKGKNPAARVDIVFMRAHYKSNALKR